MRKAHCSSGGVCALSRSAWSKAFPRRPLPPGGGPTAKRLRRCASGTAPPAQPQAPDEHEQQECGELAVPGGGDHGDERRHGQASGPPPGWRQPCLPQKQVPGQEETGPLGQPPEDVANDLVTARLVP
jgi:hypothetical protein